MMFKVWLSKLNFSEAKQNNSLQTLLAHLCGEGPFFRLPHFFWGRFTSIVFSAAKKLGVFQPCRPPASAAKPLKTCSNEDWPEIKEQNAIYQRWKEWDVHSHLVDICFRQNFDNSHQIHISYYFTNPKFPVKAIKILYSRTSVDSWLWWGIQNAVQRHTEKSLKQKRAFSSSGAIEKNWNLDNVYPGLINLMVV